MEHLRRYWIYAINHPEDIAWAAFFAFFFWLIFDLLSRDGRVRTGFRLIKNKLSERSVAKLRERIKQLEKQRDNVAAFLTSDKALYLNTFRILIAMLVMISVGAGITVLGESFPISPFNVFAVIFYAVAATIGIQGAKISALDTREKVTEMVAKRNAEIADLKLKLGKMAK